MPHRSRHLHLLFVAPLALALFLPTPTKAACCRCAIPNIIGGTVCVADDNLDCSNVASSPNQDLKGANCIEATASTHCAKVPQGLCLNDPVKPLDFRVASFAVQTKKTDSQETTSVEFKPVNLQFNVALPGVDSLDQAKLENKVLTVPYLAQYIAAIQKLAIGFGLIAAAIMIVWGGFKYIVSGTGAAVQSGKQVILDAIIGLVILLSSYALLANINPDTATLRSLQIPFVTRANAELLNDNQYSGAAAASGEKIDLKKPSPSEVIKYAVDTAKKNKLDPCIMYAIIMVESGGGKAMIGHDENQFGSVFGLVQARLDFMRSRKYYSGKPFADNIPVMPPDGACSGQNRAKCLEYSQKNVLNDDPFDPSAPPDYGLDWRFSHGIGFSQATIVPNGAKCAGGLRGYSIGGKCFTIPQLVTKEGAIDSIMAHPAFKKNADPETVFCAYGGFTKDKCSKIQALVDIKKKYYANCPYK